MGDFAEAGLLLPLDEYVDKYQPSWSDPEYGYAGGETTVTLFTKYKGVTYFVAFDNDTQPFVYRSDLFENADEGAAFADKYGYPLDFPLTWDEHRDIAEFFTRKDAEAPLYGDVMTLCAVLVRRQLQPAVRQLGQPEHALLQRGRVGERQQRGRHHGRSRRFSRTSRSTVPVRSRRTGSRSTSSWERATA